MAVGEIQVLRTVDNKNRSGFEDHNMREALELIRRHPNDAPPYSIVAQIWDFDRMHWHQIVGRCLDINQAEPIYVGLRLSSIQITLEDSEVNREGIHPVTVLWASNLRYLQVSGRL